jgi:hypothetical protein
MFCDSFWGGVIFCPDELTSFSFFFLVLDKTTSMPSERVTIQRILPSTDFVTFMEW